MRFKSKNEAARYTSSKNIPITQYSFYANPPRGYQPFEQLLRAFFEKLPKIAYLDHLVIRPTDILSLQGFLYGLIQENGGERIVQWLRQQEEKLTQPHPDRTFYLAFGTAARFANKERLSLSEAQQQQANQLKTGFQPGYWSAAQVVRVYLLLLLSYEEDAHQARLSRLLETAEVDEQVAVYAALPLLPFPQQWVALARNGLRTNITKVFDAIALHNPFPADYLPEDAWNQMVLKAVFMERPLYRIWGIDQRTNAPLARMLVDFAHERWAADRQVTPELWRLVAPYLKASHQPDLERVVHSDNPEERAAGILVCTQSKVPALESLLEDANDGESVDENTLTWDSIGRSHLLSKQQ